MLKNEVKQSFKKSINITLIENDPVRRIVFESVEDE